MNALLLKLNLDVPIARLPKLPGVLLQTCLTLRMYLRAFYKMRVFSVKYAFVIIKYSNSERVWKDIFNALAEHS
jgi:hypothetical protein